MTGRITPRTCTALHSHILGLYFRVTQGVGRFGTRDGSAIFVRLGEMINTPPGEEHWHAAATGCFMEHIAMLQNFEDPSMTTPWAEHITVNDYNGRQVNQTTDQGLSLPSV
ncbi:cupin domain-containing protein [Arthrobacter sp. ERGS1:01]|uniref:cupin domain-containing protein n=1 Tax=Arthrobacter sp. ERGS1:01 TaxID=1704044 RepID=UPI001364CD1E|nr:cupin domain-containing protein [Arthrobacter sp. ERGS1:01]